MTYLKRLARRTLDQFVKALCWSVLAGCVFWAFTQWAPSLNEPWAQHDDDTAVIMTDTQFVVIGRG